jgi:hypothetical protein
MPALHEYAICSVGRDSLRAPIHLSQLGFDLGAIPLRLTVLLPDLAQKAVFMSADVLEVVIGEKTPFLADAPLQLFPLSLDLVPHPVIINLT